MRKVFLIVSGRLFRDGLKSMLQAANMTIVAGCDTLADAADVLEGCDKPDLVVLGAQSGRDLGDLTELQILRSKMPGTRWVVLCNMSVANLLRSAVGAGIDSILLLDISAEILHHAIELVMLGHSLVPWKLTAHLTIPSEPLPIVPPPMGGQAPAEAVPHSGPAAADLAKAASRPNGTAPGPAADGFQHGLPTTRQNTLTERKATPEPSPPSVHADGLASRAVKLSDREAEILQCLVNGASNKANARDLKIAEATVKVHIRGLLRKMQLQNRTQAAIWALNNAQGIKTPAASPASSYDGAGMGFTQCIVQDSG